MGIVKRVRKALGSSLRKYKTRDDTDEIWNGAIVHKLGWDGDAFVLTEEERNLPEDRTYLKCKDIKKKFDDKIEGYQCAIEECDRCADDVCEEKDDVCSIGNLRNVCSCKTEDYDTITIANINKLKEITFDQLDHEIDRKKIQALMK